MSLSSRRLVLRRATLFSRGFTLIELMVTVAVAGILALIAVPAMSSLISGNRLAGTTGELTSSIQLARSEAVRRNSRVTLCGTSDGVNCSADWRRWIVTGADNATGEVDIIRDVSVPESIRLNGPAAGIVFRPSGLTGGEAELTVCVPTSSLDENQRVVTVMISGNISTSRASGGEACS
jgi:type IV fimbrial biogenesis protein FimT